MRSNNKARQQWRAFAKEQAMQTEYVATTKWDFVTHQQDTNGKDFTVETNFKVLTATSYEQAMQQAVALFGNNLSEVQVHTY